MELIEKNEIYSVGTKFRRFCISVKILWKHFLCAVNDGFSPFILKKYGVSSIITTSTYLRIILPTLALQALSGKRADKFPCCLQDVTPIAGMENTVEFWEILSGKIEVATDKAIVFIML